MLDLIKDLFALVGGTLGAILLVSLLAGACAGWVASASVREKGRDRQRLIGWLAPRHWQDRYRAAIGFSLDRLDHWLGDAGRPELSWRYIFGRAPPAPDWTGPALDRCAVVAFVYPVISILLVWIWAGDAGPIGELLKLIPGFEVLSRIACAIVLFSYIHMFLKSQIKQSELIFHYLFLLPVIVFLGIFSGYSGFLVMLVASCFRANSGATTGTLAFAAAGLQAAAVAYGDFFADAISTVLAAAIIGAIYVGFVFAVRALAVRARAGDWLGRFWLGFGPAMLLLAYAALALTARCCAPRHELTLIVVFVLLPLVNLPFDFASLGLTRALLRWGTRPDAPSPFLIGLVDLAAAALLMLPLAAALVIAAQAADAIAFHGAGRTFLNAPFLLDQIEEAPAAAANAWIYFMLFSTLIPSLINGIIGTASLLTAWPPRLVAWMRNALLAADARAEDWQGYPLERQLVVAVLAVQAFAAVVVTLCVFWALGWGLVTLAPWLLPLLLHAARSVAAISGDWFGLPPFG